MRRKLTSKDKLMGSPISWHLKFCGQTRSFCISRISIKLAIKKTLKPWSISLIWTHLESIMHRNITQVNMKIDLCSPNLQILISHLWTCQALDHSMGYVGTQDKKRLALKKPDKASFGGQKGIYIYIYRYRVHVLAFRHLSLIPCMWIFACQR